jgi:hypothetical protein
LHRQPEDPLLPVGALSAGASRASAKSGAVAGGVSPPSNESQAASTTLKPTRPTRTHRPRRRRSSELMGEPSTDRQGLRPIDRRESRCAYLPPLSAIQTIVPPVICSVFMLIHGLLMLIDAPALLAKPALSLLGSPSGESDFSLL